MSEKVFKAHSKGVNQLLVLMDQAALIVSANNETVITAMEREETKNQLFTNSTEQLFYKGRSRTKKL